MRTYTLSPYSTLFITPFTLTFEFLSKLIANLINVRKQSVTRVIIYGAKCAFQKFMVQSVI